MDAEENNVLIKFFSGNNDEIGSEYQVASSTTKQNLNSILRALKEDEDTDYCFMLKNSNIEITDTIEKAFAEASEQGISISTEETIGISFYSLAPYKVRMITRLSGSLKGHSSSVICLVISSDNKMMASGSGDGEVRIWDIQTITPYVVLPGHTASVTCLAFSPCCRYLVSGSEDRKILVWRTSDFNASKKIEPYIIVKAHRDTITCLSFLGAHLHKYWLNQNPILASGDRGGFIKIINITTGSVIVNLDNHTKMVTSVLWSALTKGKFDDEEYNDIVFLYSSSRDMKINIWDVFGGRLLNSIQSHGHWVNSLASNTQSIVNMNAFDPANMINSSYSMSDYFLQAEKNFFKYFNNIGDELVVSTSDDNTLILWNLLHNSISICRLVGHQSTVFHSIFSPNGRYIISASADNSIRLWDGRSGKFIHVFRGHVGSVYQLSWSSDSLKFVSASKDSTLKLWDAQAKKLKIDLPGASDEIFTVQWSYDGSFIGSGGRDCMVRIWTA